MLFGENYWGRLRSSWGSKDEQEFAREQNPAGQMSSQSTPLGSGYTGYSEEQ